MAAPESLWGWGRPQRTVSAAIVACCAVGLLIAGRPDPMPPASPPGSIVIDPNSAPSAALLALPGLGPARVDRIVAAREERPFDSIEDLARRVKGIGPATLEGMRPFVRIGSGPGSAPPR